MNLHIIECIHWYSPPTMGSAKAPDGVFVSRRNIIFLLVLVNFLNGAYGQDRISDSAPSTIPTPAYFNIAQGRSVSILISIFKSTVAIKKLFFCFFSAQPLRNYNSRLPLMLLVVWVSLWISPMNTANLSATILLNATTPKKTYKERPLAALSIQFFMAM